MTRADFYSGLFVLVAFSLAAPTLIIRTKINLAMQDYYHGQAWVQHR